MDKTELSLRDHESQEIDLPWVEHHHDMIDDLTLPLASGKAKKGNLDCATACDNGIVGAKYLQQGSNPKRKWHQETPMLI